MKPEARLKKLMRKRPLLTLAVAESMTSGRLQARIGSISGASAYFLGGITVYTLEQKVKHLGVNRAAARHADCVSQEVAMEMARGAVRLFGADVAVATTGYAEPNPAAGVMAPMAWWALCHRLGKNRYEIHSGIIETPVVNRIEAQEWVTGKVMGRLVLYLCAWHGDWRGICDLGE